MQRYFVPEENFIDGRVMITGSDAHHIQRVMRMKPSDPLICADNKGNAYLCVLERCGSGTVSASIKSKITVNPELPIQVTIAQGLPKADKFDAIIQKGTECGASVFIPFLAKRSVAVWKADKEEKKRQRLEKICKEAAEQSHRLYVPKVGAVMDMDHLLAFSSSYKHKLVAFEETAKSGRQADLSSLLHGMRAGDRLLAVIGPEGGLTQEEARIFAQNGFVLCGLGPRILRTETASIYLLAAISYHFELLNCEVDQ